MASSSKWAYVDEISQEEDTDFDYEGDSGPGGMSSGKESELDRLLTNEGEKWEVSEHKTFTYDATQFTRNRTYVLELRENMICSRSLRLNSCFLHQKILVLHWINIWE